MVWRRRTRGLVPIRLKERWIASSRETVRGAIGRGKGSVGILLYGAGDERGADRVRRGMAGAN